MHFFVLFLWLGSNKYTDVFLSDRACKIRKGILNAGPKENLLQGRLPAA